MLSWSLTGVIRCKAKFASQRRRKASPSDRRRAASEKGMWGRSEEGLERHFRFRDAAAQAQRAVHNLGSRPAVGAKGLTLRLVREFGN